VCTRCLFSVAMCMCCDGWLGSHIGLQMQLLVGVTMFVRGLWLADWRKSVLSASIATSQVRTTIVRIAHATQFAQVLLKQTSLRCVLIECGADAI
jgi:hypothetical protein